MSLEYRIVPVTPFEQNCSVVWCTETKKAAVIDPGGDIDRVLAVLEQEQLECEKILLTHGHLDHAGGAQPLSEKLQVNIVGPHSDDKFWLDAITEHTRNYGLSGMVNCTPDKWLDNDKSVMVGNQTLDIYHCPGHTPGHIIFHHKESHLAIVGDVLFHGSIGRTDFPRGDHQTLLDSIVNNLWPLGDDTNFIPGHGPMSTFGEERQSNPFVSDSALG